MTTIKLLRYTTRGSYLRLGLAVVAALILTGRGSGRLDVLAQSNPISVENAQTGDPGWDITGAGDSTIQGFATNISVNQGETITFKVNTPSTNYKLDIYRLGYYGGAGARKVATVLPSATLPQTQPACLADGATGLVDCGNWAPSASWASTGAVSGIYLARLVRIDTGGASHIVFIVRDDARKADVIVQTSDTTWQAYNRYGGASLYCASVGTGASNAGTAYAGACPNRATKVSYNRPFDTRALDARSFLFGAEYPMVRWLEANGYNVKYWAGVDTDRRGADLVSPTLKPNAFLSVGHDEYWSGDQRTRVEAARAAGVNVGFFSGNEMFWKTRYENSIDGAATPYRTLVTYKETLAGTKIDPAVDGAGHPIWTGSWRDPRFTPPADGGRPENGLTGTSWTVDSGTTAITVPASMAGLRIWQNTRVAALTSGVATLAAGSLGYEWDEDLDNGARPAGIVHLSSTTVGGVVKIIDYGATTGVGTATHNLTLYRHASGALVFGAGTIQWSWGLDAGHDGAASVPDQAMQQATMTLLADMGAQPATLQIGADPTRPLVATGPSGDTVAPTSGVTSPAAGAQVHSGDPVTITGTAADSGGVVAGVEVSVDGGATWHTAQGTTLWSFNWLPSGLGTATLSSRAIDDSGNVGAASSGVSVSVVAGTCPCTSIWKPSTVPAVPSINDPSAVELGVKFTSEADGFITGIRFYKGGTNVGTHIGNLWTIGGTLLATATFAGESSSGWQQVTFNAPVAITKNTVYVASYHTNVGGYASDGGYFTAAGVDSPPLHALAANPSGGNGVYRYGSTAFPSNTFNATNYYVDVAFAETVIDSSPLTISEINASAIDGSTAVVTWKTTKDATSSIDYSTDPGFPSGSTLTASNGAFVKQHSLTLTGLTPNATYYFIISAVDHDGNFTMSTAPSFTVPGPTLHDTASVDFLAGTPDASTYLAASGDGEVILKPTVGSEFSGSALPPGWIEVPFDTLGYSVVAEGALLVDGARVASCVTDGNGVCVPETPEGTSSAVYSAPHALDFVANFSGDRFQHAGLAQTLWSTSEPWAVFSTSNVGSLFARTNVFGTITETPLGTGLLGSPHRFRIDWQTAKVDYYVDDGLVASHAVTLGGLLRPVAASDFNVFGGSVVVDWMRMSPYAATATFQSRVFDAMSAVTWNTVYWKTATPAPAGTSVAMSVRTGNTATPDGSWTSFVPVAAPGPITAQGRYVQYQAVLATSDVSHTPSLEDVIVTTARPPVAVNDAKAVNVDTAFTFPASGTGSLKANDTDPDTPLAQLRVVAVTAPAHGVSILNVDGSVSYTPASGFIGTDTFTYTISDGLLTSTATVSMEVGGETQVNSNPVANNDAATVGEDSGANAIDVLANDSTAPDIGETLTVTAVTQGANGGVTFTATNVSYTPAGNYNGSDSFTYTIGDGHGGSATASVSVTVTSVNDAPSFTKGTNQTVLKGTSAQTVSNWATAISRGAPNESGQALNFIVTNGNNLLFSVQPAVSDIGTLTYTPAAGKSGSATVTVALHDTGGTANGGVDTSAPQTFTITVVDQPPVALCQNVTVAATLVGTATASINNGSFDPDGVSVTLAQVPPGPYSAGQTTVVLNVTDQANQTTSCSATVTVTPFSIGAAYGFEEASGNIVVDSSGNQNNGTFNAANGPTRVAGGRFGKGMRFDGVDDLITVADSNTLDLTSAMTMMAWVKVENQIGWRTILFKHNVNDLTYGLYANNNPSVVGTPIGYVNSGGAIRNAAATESVLQARWMHIAVTFGGGSLKMYVNGVLERTVATPGTIAVTQGPLWLGGDLDWLDEYFSGVMDEVRILGVALSVADIRTLMRTPVVAGTAPPATDPTGLVAAYNFDNATATDVTGHGHNGVLNGAVGAAGMYGQALSFDGTSAIVTIPDANDLHFTNAMTLEAWVRPATVTGWRTVILKERPQGLAYGLYASDAAQHAGTFVNIAGTDRDARAPAPLALNAWNHVVATYDKNEGMVRVWIDGIPVSARSQTGDITVASGSLFIGGNQFWGEYFNGRIDNVRIYNRALDTAEIQTNQITPVF